MIRPSKHILHLLLENLDRPEYVIYKNTEYMWLKAKCLSNYNPLNIRKGATFKIQIPTTSMQKAWNTYFNHPQKPTTQFDTEIMLKRAKKFVIQILELKYHQKQGH